MKVRREIFLKSNEVLAPKEYAGGLALKPRTIISLDPTIQAETFSDINACTQKLKESLRHSFQVGPYCCQFTVGSGLTSEGLDYWLERAQAFMDCHHTAIAAIFAGDDFFAIYKHDGKTVFIEDDFSIFDRTEGVHALNSEYRVLHVLGCAAYSLQIIKEVNSTTPTYLNRRMEIKVKCPMPYQRSTGGPDTSLGNTIVGMLAKTYVLSTEDPENLIANMAASQAKLGLISKLQVHSELMDATFLKGWWADGKNWYPLPSQVIKAGKVMSDPRTVFKNRTPLEAWRNMAYAVGCGYGDVPKDYPIFGVLIQKYKEHTSVFVPNVIDEHKVRYTGKHEFNTRPEVLAAIGRRYGLDQAEVLEMEQILRDAPLPSISYHEGFTTLMVRDYA